MKTQTHHKFMKREPRNVPDLGDYLPSFSVDEKTNIYDYITNYLVVVVLSTTCPPCRKALEVVYEFVNKTPNANIVMLINADAESFLEVKELFADKLNVFLVSDKLIRSYFQGVPWGLSLNAYGQIVGSYAFDNPEWFEKIIYPVKSLIIK
ncbi:hypothetical protein NDS46_12635 [Paenibacillus thiaminolyticus]|uniref:TlpA family protein disulfide reductase n=1 Tax=Paenibacillus thiaminolyticus TaxID=49283 RepID=UPI002330FC47|nr:hypothetical protein [Paenibacillus thiaminolyticus]WCF10632.1 hypothetical protein NDS46_12635 [Paenibacillus thiaminolyticus]